MTNLEAQCIAGNLLVLAHATEELMRQVLNIEKQPLSHEAKQMWNGMLKGVKQAQFYYGRFTDLIATAIWESDGNDATRQDQMRREAMETIRLRLAIENAAANGYPPEEIEKAIRQMSEGKQKKISDTVIDKFRLK